MITRIEVSNFGCFDEATHGLNLSPETFLIGPNNVGKSTFLAAYAILAQGRYYYPLTKFSNYPEAVFGHKKNEQIKLSVYTEYKGKTGTRFFLEGRQQGSGWSAHSEANQELERCFSNTWYLTSDRVFIPTLQSIGQPQPVVSYRADNIVAFLLERWTSRDPQWSEAEEWLRKIDPDMSLLKSPLRGNTASIETTRKYANLEADINVSFQGGGIQRALQIISTVVFSPRGSVIIIEEPEMNLHKETQEIIVDLFNKAVNEWDKQIIVTTHSWDMILPFISDVGCGSKRGADHIKADPSKFKLVTFSFNKKGSIAIEDYDLAHKEMKQIKSDFKIMWG